MEKQTNPIREKYLLELKGLKHRTEQIDDMDFRTLSEINNSVYQIQEQHNVAPNYKSAFHRRIDWCNDLIYSKSNSRKRLFATIWKETKDDLRDLVEFGMA